MNATETTQLKALIEQIRHDGVTVLLIEHDVKLVMGLCDRLTVLDFGKKIAEDVPSVVQKNEAVINAYLGAASMHNSNPASPILQLKDVQIAYGGIHAVKGIDLELYKGELVCLIGANGAGKTTTLNALAGTLTLAGGDLVYEGESIAAMPAHKRLRKGIALVPEGRGIFTRLTVEENCCAWGHTSATTPPRSRRTWRRFTPCCPHQGAPATGCGHALGRRAADGGDRSRAALAPAPAAPRRTFDGPCPAGGGEDLRGGPDGQGRGRDHPAGRAERQPRAGVRAARVCHGFGQDQHHRKRRRTARQPAVREAYLGEAA